MSLYYDTEMKPGNPANAAWSENVKSSIASPQNESQFVQIERLMAKRVWCNLNEPNPNPPNRVNLPRVIHNYTDIKLQNYKNTQIYRYAYIYSNAQKHKVNVNEPLKSSEPCEALGWTGWVPKGAKVISVSGVSAFISSEEPDEIVICVWALISSEDPDEIVGNIKGAASDSMKAFWEAPSVEGQDRKFRECHQICWKFYQQALK